MLQDRSSQQMRMKLLLAPFRKQAVGSLWWRQFQADSKASLALKAFCHHFAIILPVRTVHFGYFETSCLVFSVVFAAPPAANPSRMEMDLSRDCTTDSQHQDRPWWTLDFLNHCSIRDFCLNWSKMPQAHASDVLPIRCCCAAREYCSL